MRHHQKCLLSFCTHPRLYASAPDAAGSADADGANFLLESSQREPKVIDGILARGEKQLWGVAHPDPYIGGWHDSSRTLQLDYGER